ncbi:hypothetical protein D3C71_1405020 [compost metagenome]
MGRFAYLAERRGCRRHAGSTDSPGANPDSQMAGPGARSAEGLGAWMHPTIPGHRNRYQHGAPRMGRFAYLAERKGCRGHAGSTDSLGANPDSRMAGPVVKRRGEVHGCTSQSHSENPKVKPPRKGRFAHQARERDGRGRRMACLVAFVGPTSPEIRARVLDRLAIQRGLPRVIRTDNGKEFCGKAMAD